MNHSIYQPELLAHSTHPANHSEPDHYSIKAALHNPVCGDQITLFLNVDSEHIDAAHFTGSGCAVCIASASMMTIKLKGAPLSEARNYHRAMEQVLAGNIDDSFVCNIIRPLTTLAGHKGRLKCTLLAWRALDKALLALSDSEKEQS